MEVIDCGLSVVRRRWGQGRTPQESPVCCASRGRSGAGKGKRFLSVCHAWGKMSGENSASTGGRSAEPTPLQQWPQEQGCDT